MKERQTEKCRIHSKLLSEVFYLLRLVRALCHEIPETSIQAREEAGLSTRLVRISAPHFRSTLSIVTDLCPGMLNHGLSGCLKGLNKGARLEQQCMPRGVSAAFKRLGQLADIFD